MKSDRRLLLLRLYERVRYILQLLLSAPKMLVEVGHRRVLVDYAARLILLFFYYPITYRQIKFQGFHIYQLVISFDEFFVLVLKSKTWLSGVCQPGELVQLIVDFEIILIFTLVSSVHLVLLVYFDVVLHHSAHV